MCAVIQILFVLGPIDVSYINHIYETTETEGYVELCVVVNESRPQRAFTLMVSTEAISASN